MSQDLDHYKTLGLERNATPEQIKKSYRKLAMKWHPDRNPTNKDAAEEKFKSIGEAYSVLSDKDKKKNYDEFGSAKARPQFNSSGFDGASYKNNFSSANAEDIFKSFFSSFDNGGFNNGGFSNGRSNNGGFTQPKSKGKLIVYPLNLSLEQIYTGTTKNVKITRKRLNSDNKTCRNESKMISINIKKGYKAGTKITFDGEGDEMPGVLPGDIQFIIKEKTNYRFEREGNNLIYSKNITLKQALLGVNIPIKTLDDRRLNVSIKPNTISGPNYIHYIHNEGMPISKTNGSKSGDLLIKFNIIFPKNLTGVQQNTIRRCLN